MRQLVLTAFLLGSLAMTSAQITPVSHAAFYPYGPGTGDILDPTADDSTSGPQALSTAFPFFGNTYNELFVNTNGDISFGVAVTSYTPRPFPVTNNRVLAVYFTDIKTSNGGRSGYIYHRETTDAAILARATGDIQTAFPADHGSFVATWVYIATWHEVGLYDESGYGGNLRNTFQLVLITDGQKSFTLYNYARIDFLQGETNGGNGATGTGPNPAQVGINGGNGVHYALHPYSRTTNLYNLPTWTDPAVPGPPGRWTRRTDLATVGDAIESLEVFSTVKGTGQSVYDAWAASPGAEIRHVKCPILDLWDTLPIKLVKVVLNTPDGDKEFLFNGENSNKFDWFSKSRMLSSSYDDISTEPQNFFSIPGETNVKRRFYLSRSHNGCEGDLGWMMVAEGGYTSGFCWWERVSTYNLPYIKYSKRSGYARWAYVDECANSNGGCAQTCNNNVGSFTCSCPAGYVLNADGFACDDVDECANSNGGCAQTCNNNVGSFTCSCPAGYVLNADGLNCDDVDECANSNGGCAQTCNNNVGSFTCSCTTGYVLNADGFTCDDCATAYSGLRPASNFGFHQGHCFWSSNRHQRLTYAAALQACQSHGGTLIMIKDSATHTFIMNHLKRKSVKGRRERRFWIGLDDINDENVYLWNDGTPLGAFNRWKSTAPHKIRDCVTLWKKPKRAPRWYIKPCSNSYPYICQLGVSGSK
ncbi:PREDICTED: uncharacterized protein LOC109464868 [Branchiostoma belcheri]|uniref:Uncharacterized protein LOC109464868 n=1 Tax=Branchiostoma belcheri TaxID=7741 RepID=A0A6P4YFG6_BRABE|nr:PREDICTED: uncharacterized protein LOC109464868 [Branchiostoma belcheri]